MLFVQSNEEPADVSRIAQVLRNQEGVVDARVWVQKESVLACVTVTCESSFDEGSLISACVSALGEGNAPNMIMLQRAMRPAA